MVDYDSVKIRYPLRLMTWWSHI